MIRHLFKLFFVLFALSFGQSVWANCTVNGVSYKTNGGSGTAITTAIIKNHASSLFSVQMWTHLEPAIILRNLKFL